MGWWLFPPPQPLIYYSWIFWNDLLYMTLLLSNLQLFHVPNSISWLIWKGRCQKKTSAHAVKLLTGSCLFRTPLNFNLNCLMQRHFTKAELTQTSCLLNECSGDKYLLSFYVAPLHLQQLSGRIFIFVSWVMCSPLCFLTACIESAEVQMTWLHLF